MDIALRCDGYLVHIEVKIDNRSINKLQPSEQFMLGHRLSEGESRKFIHVFLTPDSMASGLVKELETKHITWIDIKDKLQVRIGKFENKVKPSKTSSAQIVVREFLGQFIDRIERRVIVGEFKGFDQHIFKRRFFELGGYVDESAVRSSLGDFLTVVRRKLEKSLPNSLKDTQFAIGTRSGPGCYLYCYFYDYHRLNIQLFFDLVADTGVVGLWLNNARHRPKLLNDLELKQSQLAGINTKWPEKGTWTAIGPNIWNIENSHKMLDQAVEQLSLYLRTFGPTIKAYVRQHHLGTAGKRNSRQGQPDDSEPEMEVPYPPSEEVDFS